MPPSFSIPPPPSPVHPSLVIPAFAFSFGGSERPYKNSTLTPFSLAFCKKSFVLNIFSLDTFPPKNTLQSSSYSVRPSPGAKDCFSLLEAVFPCQKRILPHVVYVGELYVATCADRQVGKKALGVMLLFSDK